MTQKDLDMSLHMYEVKCPKPSGSHSSMSTSELVTLHERNQNTTDIERIKEQIS